MEYIEFGKTGLKASKAGLGCGGHSRLGQSQGASHDSSVAVVHAALDQGINFIDTAATYGTEKIVGDALKGRRETAIISTKAIVVHEVKPATNTKVNFVTPTQLRTSLEESLKNLRTDYIDIFNLHAVTAAHYGYCQSHLIPELQKFRDEGKIRFIGVTEQFIKDTEHRMLEIALQDDFWDVMMVGFNMLNPSARDRVFNITRKNGIATLGMFAVRKALSDGGTLTGLLQSLIHEGKLKGTKIDIANPLGFLLAHNDASSIANAAYRFCSNEPGVDVVLTGTGNIEHLRENTASIIQGPLSSASLKRLRELFGDIDTVSGN